MNFNKKEDRIKYLEDKFDNLLDVIGENYGTALMEELVARLNDTIDDFNKEMSSLFKTLKEREQERQKYLNNISNNIFYHLIFISVIKTTMTCGFFCAV